MVEETLWQQALRYANRANPYPFYAELRKTPVARQPDGTYVVSTYREIMELLHDPRVSSDITKSPSGDRARVRPPRTRPVRASRSSMGRTSLPKTRPSTMNSAA